MNHDLTLLGHIAAAMGCGFAIGWEREIRNQPAGDRTFALVALGSSAVTAIAVDVFPANADRLIVGVVTGIGFIGAGLVLHTDPNQPRGLTTATAIWATAAVGILAGLGRLILALGVTLLILLLLEFRNIPLLQMVDARRFRHQFNPDESPPDSNSQG